MNILTTKFNLKHNALEIYVAGCGRSPHCEGCHNPESWDFSKGIDLKDIKKQIKNKIEMFNQNINCFWILGGEPLDNPDINKLVNLLEEYNKEMWLFTSYELNEIGDIKEDFNYIKTGRYKSNETGDNIQYGLNLASKNQMIYKRGKNY